MATPRPGTVAWREEHGISSEVYEARGYVRYARGDVKLIEKYFGGFAPNQLRWAKGVAKRTSDEGGLIMPAYALPLSELRLRPIPPQLRPDNPLRKRRDPAHWHPAQLPPRGTEVLFEGKRVPEDRWSTAWVMRLHIASDPDHGKELAAELGYRTKDQISQLVSDPRCQGDLDRVLAEGNNPEPHQHQEWAKYLLPRVPERPLRHDHRHYADGAARRRHIDKYHSGREEDVIGWHVHDGMRFQEVMVDVTYEEDPRASPGRRLDMLPLAWERLPAAEVVHFILEGKIKADSCLSAILDSNRSATALNVPSVGQWEAFELETFAELLRGKRVVVVVDSDADGNDNVMTQGLLLRARLERHDCLRVCLAAPPADDRVGIDEEDRFDKVGLDDHLGALGRTLDELEVIRREVPDREFDNWRAAYASLALRSDRLERDARVLYGIALLCGELGQTTASRQKIAAFVGLTADDVERAVDALWQAGVVSIDGKPYPRKRGESAKRRRWPLSRPRSTRRKGHGRVFLAPPRILITDRKLWAKRLPRMRLEAWLRNPPKERTMSELLIPTARGARFADAYVANGGSVRKLAEEAGVSVRTLQRMPEVQTMIGLRQAVIDLLVIALRSIGLSPPVIAEELTSRGVKVSTGAVRRILDQRTRHAPAWAWEALLENQEIATLTIAALERHDQAAADELVRLLFNEVCQGPPSGQETTRSAGRETLDSANSVGRVTIVDTSAALCGVAGEEQNQDRLDPARDGAVSGCDRFGRSPPFDPSSTP